MSTTWDRLSLACSVVAPFTAPEYIDEWLANDKALGAALGGAAQREARRILAETERVPSFAPLGQPYIGGVSLRSLWFDGGNAKTALAEALAAFIATPLDGAL